MMSHKQRRNQKEAGGILLGEQRGKHIVVRFITSPKKKDIRKSTFFHRKDPLHIVEGQTVLRDHPTISYLGEWHTHPQWNPKPSALDTKQWYQLQRTRHRPLVFIIVGVNTTYVRFGSHVLPRIEKTD